MKTTPDGKWLLLVGMLDGLLAGQAKQLGSEAASVLLYILATVMTGVAFILLILDNRRSG